MITIPEGWKIAQFEENETNIDRFNSSMLNEADKLGFKFRPGSTDEHKSHHLSKEIDGHTVDFIISPKFETMMFSVDQKFARDTNISKKTRIKMALALKTMFETAMRNMRLEPGHIIGIDAYGEDGKENQEMRIKAYQAFGFGPPDKNGRMATKIGKEMKLNPMIPKTQLENIPQQQQQNQQQQTPQEQEEQTNNDPYWDLLRSDNDQDEDIEYDYDDDDFSESENSIPIDAFYAVLFNSKMR